VGRALKNDVIFRQFTAWVRVNFSTFNLGENHPIGDFLESGTDFRLSGVGGMIAPIQFQIFKENGTLLDKPPFLALKRCVKHIIIFISYYTRNFSLFWDNNAYSTIRNLPNTWFCRAHHTIPVSLCVSSPCLQLLRQQTMTIDHLLCLPIIIGYKISTGFLL
jgi:hypothetical protein